MACLMSPLGGADSDGTSSGRLLRREGRCFLSCLGKRKRGSGVAVESLSVRGILKNRHLVLSVADTSFFRVPAFTGRERRGPTLQNGGGAGSVKRKISSEPA